MQIIKLLFECRRTNKLLGKSFKINNKRELSNTQLEKHLEVASKTQNNILNIFKPTYVLLYICFEIFITVPIALYLPEPLLLPLIPVILFLLNYPPISFITFLSHLESSQKQLKVNKLIELLSKDEYKEKICILDSKNMIEKFANYYQVDTNTDLIILDNTENLLMCYCCSRDGYIMRYRIDEITEKLVNSNKITLNEFTEQIRTS